jgi:tetratricopeptide repeat protein
MADNPRIEELRRRVHADPASIAFAALAEEYRRTGNYAEAIETCRIGLQRHPSYLSARVTLGRALMETAQYDDARSELEVVLKSAPENLAAIRGLAEIHERQRSLPESAPVIAAPDAGDSPAVSAGSIAAATATAVAPAIGLSAGPVTSLSSAALSVLNAPAVSVSSAAPPSSSNGPALSLSNGPALSLSKGQNPGSDFGLADWVLPPKAPEQVSVREPVPVLAAPVIAPPVMASTPDPAITRLEMFLVAIQSARGAVRLSR